MEVKIALAGNPNCGKTTLFNALTGSSQYVGNWPGVTVEKKEGRLKGHPDVIIQDLPGIYSLSPCTPEEVVSRTFLVKERPDAILNIVDGTNMERSLYLTTQLIELGLPMVVAVNMIDLVRKKGDSIDLARLGTALGCEMLEISALKNEGGLRAAERAGELARTRKVGNIPRLFTGSVERALARIEESIRDRVEAQQLRWYSIKVFERDEKVLEELGIGGELRSRLEEHIAGCERELEDDAESIITSQRYDYIGDMTAKAVVKKNPNPEHAATLADRIDVVVTNRVLALPIFAAVMFLIYAIAMGPWPVSVGARLSDWANDGLFGEGWFVPFTHDGVWVPGVPVLIENALDAIHCSDVVKSLVLDGIVGGVGAVLGFLPQLMVLFLLLTILEDVGYMSRIAFIMDRLFRRFGLSGKSFIPLLVATGCGVSGVMASRTIGQDRDRKMTIMTTCFMPCSAKMPIIGLFAGALFGKSVWVAVSAYFIGAGAVAVSGLILKKFKAFQGEPAPFVMELPAYHLPSAASVLRTAAERGWSFVERAGTVILLSGAVLWFLQSFGFEGGAFGLVSDSDFSLLATVGRMTAVLFVPLGFGRWQTAVATLAGLIAKEEVVAALQVLYPGDLYSSLGEVFTGPSACSFMIFNLLCAPCVAAMGAIRREMNSFRWTWAAIGYMCGFAYVIALIVYQLGGLLTGTLAFNPFTVAALVLLAGLLYLMLRPAALPAAAGRAGL